MRFSPVRLSNRHALAVCAMFGFCALSNTALPSSFTTLRTFVPATDGNAPQAELTQGTDGRFYGTNSLNGPNNNGSVFSISADGTSFRSLSSFGPISTGLQPNGSVVQASDGFFYGTTYSGGANGVGILFRIDTLGNLTRLLSFNTGDPGANPAGTLIQGVDGFLYGTAQFGGINNFGTIFRTSIADGTTATLSELGGGTDGLYPESDLVQASDGNFYGTTYSGGTYNAGTIFRVTPSGTRTVIYTFTGTTGDGGEPLRGVTLGRDGYLYGIAVTAGANSGGSIYRVTTDGKLTVLYSFLPQIGSPYTSLCRLVQASDGNFYGTTNLGGVSNVGTIFKMTPTGGFSAIYSFANSGDGGYPTAGLVQGMDGKLYGTTTGQNGQTAGTIYRVDLSLPVPTPQPVLFAPTTVNVGDTIMIKGDYFLGVTGVAFPTASGSAPANYTVLSKTMIQAVVPAGAISGVVTVSNGVLLAATPAALTVNAVTPPVPPAPPVLPVGNGPTVSITTPDPVAVEGSSNTGKFKFKRVGDDLSQPLTVVLKIKGSAVRGVDYDLYVGSQVLATVTNSVTIPAGAAKLSVIVQPIANTSSATDGTVVIKVKAGADYTVSDLNKATVTLAADE